MMRTFFRFSRVLSVWFCLLLVTACSLKDLVSVNDPEEGSVLTRGYVESRQGSIGVVLGGYHSLQAAVSWLSLYVGLATDELAASSSANDISPVFYMIDSRALGFQEGIQLSGGDGSSAYTLLQKARIQSMQGRDLLARFADDSTRRYTALAFAVEGYAVLMFAENFCSGVPLSIARYGSDIKYAAGSSTDVLFQTAGQLFDSAIALVPSGDPYAVLAHTGRMRAYLGQGLLDSAFAHSAMIDPGFLFTLEYTNTVRPGSTTGRESFWTDSAIQDGRNRYNSVELIASEGGVGRIWYSRSPVIIDPRVPVQMATGELLPAVVRPRKFFGGAIQFPLASGLEAALVRAEYALANGGNWLEILNTARRTVGLPDTTAPSSHAAAVDLLFGERAAWHYLEGRRIADLRRLIHQYSRDPHTVYPNGSYLRGSGSISVYGSDWVFTPDPLERNNNARYEGCEHQNP